MFSRFDDLSRDAREIRSLAPPDPDASFTATTRKDAGRWGVTTQLVMVVRYDRSAAHRSATSTPNWERAVEAKDRSPVTSIAPDRSARAA